MAHAYDASSRVHPCPSCFEPTEVPRGGGQATCPAQHGFPVAAPVDAPVGEHVAMDETRRLAALRTQDDPPHLDRDAAIAAYGGRETLSAAESPALWLRTLAAHQGPDSDLRLMHVTVASANSIAHARGQRAARATMEAALDWISDPRLRNELHTMLARGAAREGDLESADAWLAPCDLKPRSLREDSSVRISRAILALQRGEPAQALGLVGEHDGEVPIGSRNHQTAVLTRAHALELLGRDSAARTALREQMARRDPGGAVAVCESAPIWHPMVVCPKNLPAVAAEHFRAATRHQPISVATGNVQALVGVFQLVAAFALAVTGAAIGNWIMLAAAAAMGGLGAFLWIRGRGQRPRLERLAQVARDGEPRLAQIVGIRYTGMSVNSRRIAHVDVEIALPDAAPRRTTVDCYIPKRTRPSSTAWGVYAWIPVRVDPGDPTLAVADSGPDVATP